jgi:hypothetical protein
MEWQYEDPLGRTIALLDEIWYGKILRDHAELGGALWAVESTLRDPALITYDKAYENREVYYKRVTLPAPWGHSLLKVVVEFLAPSGGGIVSLHDGEVITAYSAYNVNPDEEYRWSP